MAIGRGDITGLVLAGGKGSRMAGADKGLQRLHGETLAARALARLSPQVGPLLVSANRNLAAYAGLGVTVLTDTFADAAGPLAGMLSGLEACTTPLLAVVPCDAPRFPADLVARLAAPLSDPDIDVAAVATPHGTVSRIEPMFLVARPCVANSLRAYLARGSRRAADWIVSERHVLVPFADAAAFVNANTTADLQALEADG